MSTYRKNSNHPVYNPPDTLPSLGNESATPFVDESPVRYFTDPPVSTLSNILMEIDPDTPLIGQEPIREYYERVSAQNKMEEDKKNKVAAELQAGLEALKTPTSKTDTATKEAERAQHLVQVQEKATAARLEYLANQSGSHIKPKEMRNSQEKSPSRTFDHELTEVVLQSEVHPYQVTGPDMHPDSPSLHQHMARLKPAPPNAPEEYEDEWNEIRKKIDKDGFNKFDDADESDEDKEDLSKPKPAMVAHQVDEDAKLGIVVLRRDRNESDQAGILAHSPQSANSGFSTTPCHTAPSP
ncbi:hypothetical protein P154DRAFT_599112 [Amniculicola lignicola CBS 123094]|uniref:Uncharacterized protein n=1 Tax=Amniculicola lignicola CBS 123094 TaxID=1392246 RepID=A0A6A5WM99_9PLEO|nr:hypothetical protein P154DRAFT_599112 [Amniculicola lignicola CBS 123094]